MSLKMGDVKRKGTAVVFATSAFKCVVNHYPVGEFELPKLRLLNLQVVRWIVKRQDEQATPGDLLFPFTGNPAGWINTLLRKHKSLFEHEVPALSHGFKRGCVSILDGLNFKRNLLNAHVGWVHNS